MSHHSGSNLFGIVKALRVLALVLAALIAAPAAAQDGGVTPPPLVTEVTVTPTGITVKPIRACASRPCWVPMKLVGDITVGSPDSLAKYVASWAEAKPDGYFLYINSTGGSWDGAKKIFRILAELDVPVHCLVDEDAQSGAFLILQACNVRASTPVTALMVHEAKFQVPADTVMSAADMLTGAEELQTSNDIMATYIAAHSKVKKSSLLRRIARGDWTMTAATALHFGFIDFVFPGNAQQYLKLLDGK